MGGHLASPTSLRVGDPLRARIVHAHIVCGRRDCNTQVGSILPVSSFRLAGGWSGSGDPPHTGMLGAGYASTPDASGVFCLRRRAAKQWEQAKRLGIRWERFIVRPRTGDRDVWTQRLPKPGPTFRFRCPSCDAINLVDVPVTCQGTECSVCVRGAPPSASVSWEGRTQWSRYSTGIDRRPDHSYDQ
jgi:hypothetical protein